MDDKTEDTAGTPASAAPPDAALPPPDGASPDDATLVSSEHVGFAVGDQAFAFCMTKVLEIIRVPRAVMVPMTPTALLGLANLRGRVLPILDFRTLVGLEPRTTDEATRVIVVDIGQTVGLVVDRVARVMHVEARDVDPAEDIESFVGRDLLDGVVKQPGGALVQLVDPEKVVGLKFSLADIREAAETSLGLSDLGRVVADTEGEDEANRLVSVCLAGQDYGLAIEHVDEIVRVPDSIGTVPNAPPHVLGIITLRSRVLPLVCMRRMLGLPTEPLSDSHRVVVVRTADRSGALRRIGLVVDKVNAVIRIDPKAVSEVPDLLAEGSRGDITAICRLDDGRRLVSVLGIDRMFRSGALPAGVGAGPERDDPEDAVRESKMTTEPGAEDLQAIVFQMIDQEFGIMVEHVQEILRVPDVMTEVPKTSAYVEGMMNLRGGVLPVIDLRVRLGLPKQARGDRQRVIVLDLNGRRTGFVVDGVSEVLRMPADAVIETPRMSTVEQRVLSRAVKLNGGNRLILLVDPCRLMEGIDTTGGGVPAAA
ncbi:chemotaxis protein CheW [Roseospira marina]|uniref:Chemotaxis protein CheW n=1 Tax=Roseospira marina TaxID=140057 RepID=A0A5M6I6E4_9PROT|nr:chemotaxis protein CheW [Roseospira marina]KAA5603816.1 chemotaxis protein CheW [Roseospira marina]MBB4316028.1 purine-binding chemotaxis protein CheW [Roseospira marina]MBB5089194.1 purine-binding chemotaxis protein CheW [Roseospira marina]